MLTRYAILTRKSIREAVLQSLYNQGQMDSIILQITFTLLHMIELLAPVDFEAGAFLRQNAPT